MKRPTLAVSVFSFWASAGGIAWLLVGYPFALRLYPRRPWRTDSDFRPLVSVIVPAFNERQVLAEKLRGLDCIDYDEERLQIIVMVDEDEESARLARLASPRAMVVFNPERRGKFLAVFEGIQAAKGDIVLLTDANNTLARDTVARAVRHFADESVWGVTGQRHEQGSAYERYESLLRRLESRSGSVAAASGEVLFVRRDRIPAAPAKPPVHDDFWLLCRLVEAGGRVVFEPDARSSEPGISTGSELERRSRLAAGLAEALHEARDVSGDFRVRLLSHKFGRLALPWLLAGTLASSAALGRRPLYRAVLLAQLAGYSLGVLASVGITLPGRGSVVSSGARQFLFGNLAAFRGLARAARGRQSVVWTPVR